MKNSFMRLVLVCGALLQSMHAATKTGDQPATVVSVERHDTQSGSSFAGGNPSDSPLQPQSYSYDIGIRVGSAVYRTRYDSALDYLPAAFAANHPIQVHLMKRAVYVTLPDDRAVRMAVGRRPGVPDASRQARN